jgi:hypothetical protein
MAVKLNADKLGARVDDISRAPRNVLEGNTA